MVSLSVGEMDEMMVELLVGAMDEMTVALMAVRWVEQWVVRLVALSVGEMVEMDEMMVALTAVH